MMKLNRCLLAVGLISAIALSLTFSCSNEGRSKSSGDISVVKLEWVKGLQDDFSFSHNWNYPLGVGLKKDGRPGCADGGFCPERCYGMLDENGIVLKDSVDVFYQLLDTSHQFHSIECDAWCYEWAGTDFIDVLQLGEDSVYCETQTNIATHCSLELNISKHSCTARINLISIIQGGNALYECEAGEITIDEDYWKKGILKARFDFKFHHPENPSKPIYWKGKIYKEITKV